MVVTHDGLSAGGPDADLDPAGSPAHPGPAGAPGPDHRSGADQPAGGAAATAIPTGNHQGAVWGYRCR